MVKVHKYILFLYIITVFLFGDSNVQAVLVKQPFTGVVSLGPTAPPDNLLEVSEGDQIDGYAIYDDEIVMGDLPYYMKSYPISSYPNFDFIINIGNFTFKGSDYQNITALTFIGEPSISFPDSILLDPGKLFDIQLDGALINIDGVEVEVFVGAQILEIGPIPNEPNDYFVGGGLHLPSSKPIVPFNDTQAELFVTHPNGGEILTKSQNYTITWQSAIVSNNIQIDLYKGGNDPANFILQLAASDPDDGDYPFNPPDYLEDGSDYLIGISDEAGTVSDFSDNFFIIQSALPSSDHIYDDFNGTNIDGSKWQIDDGNNAIEQYGGILHIDAPPYGAWASVWPPTNYSGDFDIVLYWHYFYQGSVIWINNVPQVLLQVNSENGGFSIVRADFVAGGYYFSEGTSNGNFMGHYDARTSDTSGRFRITRTGTEVSTYYWNNGWQELLNYQNFVTDDVSFRLTAFTGDNQEAVFHAGFDRIDIIGTQRTLTDVVGKVYCGYQGWFLCEGDGSPIDKLADTEGWRHWSVNLAPSPDSQTFDLYPDISEYPISSLFLTNYSNFPNKNPATLFSSYSNDVIEKHFKWMKEYNLDGIALQRFGVNLKCEPSWPHCWNKETIDDISVKVKNAAELYNRLFYIMYDISGMDAFSTDIFKDIRDDWQYNISEALNLISSSQYGKHNGKPVVGIWGIGFLDRPGSVEELIDLINWFHQQGCYVAGSVPIDWRTEGGQTKTGFLQAFELLDMVSPWTPGRNKTIAEIDSYKTVLQSDKEYCISNGIDYQPVFYPGFSWSNWKPGPANEIPRNGGEFMWRQAYNIASLGIDSAYIAMFDEYDEATAISKAAEDSSMIPPDQYFLTLSADGIYLSSDFYLRVAEEATKMIKGEIPLTLEIPTPHSTGPVFFRSSLENGFDAIPTWVDTVDELGGGKINVTDYSVQGFPECGIVSGEQAHSGSFSIRYSGRDNSIVDSYCYFKVFDVDIPISTSTKLSYWMYPQQELGRYVSVDLIMSDGITLRDSGAIDLNGNSMHPSDSKGSINTWSQVICNIGDYLDGKTIDRITVGYDHSFDTGEFRGYVDDIIIWKLLSDYDGDSDSDGADLAAFIDDISSGSAQITIENFVKEFGTR